MGAGPATLGGITGVWRKLLIGLVLEAALLTTVGVVVVDEAFWGGRITDVVRGVFVVDLLFPGDSTAPGLPGVTNAGSCEVGALVAAASAAAAAAFASASASSAAARAAIAAFDLLGRFALLLALISP